MGVATSTSSCQLTTTITYPRSPQPTRMSALDLRMSCPRCSRILETESPSRTRLDSCGTTMRVEALTVSIDTATHLLSEQKVSKTLRWTTTKTINWSFTRPNKIKFKKKLSLVVP